MKQLLVFSPEEADGCSFYRGLGVLGELHRQDILIRRAPRFISWSELCDCDIGFMLRPFSQKHVEIAKMIKQQMPLWIDYDDDLFNIPECNPAYDLYSNQEVIESIQHLKALADVVTVSTKGVQDSFGGQIILNAYNDYRLPKEFFPVTREKKVVLWRGTGSHVGDLLAFEDDLNYIIAYSNYKFVFIGFNPWMLEPSKNISYIPARDIYSYNKVLEIVNPDILIVPLEDNKLNQSKSNIAWLEVARFGTTTVARDWEEWDKPKILGYDEVFDHFESVFKKATLGDKMNQSAWDYIQNNLFLSQVNKQRLEIVDQLLS